MNRKNMKMSWKMNFKISYNFLTIDILLEKVLQKSFLIDVLLEKV